MERKTDRRRVLLTQTIAVATALICWEMLPRVEALRSRTHLLDPFFISSPSRVATKLVDLAIGSKDTGAIWPFMVPTLEAALVGIVVGLALGAGAGLALGSSPFLSQVFRPFIIAMNAIPRIALIPIVVILVGPTFQASIVICVLVVFFVGFFNAYEGSRSVSPDLLNNAKVLGANSSQVMWHIRSRYALAWTLATLPLAATFSVIAVVTGEFLTGYPGLGRLIVVASYSADATLTWAVVVVLATMGLAIVGIADVLKQRLLHWWAR